MGCQHPGLRARRPVPYHVGLPTTRAAATPDAPCSFARSPGRPRYHHWSPTPCPRFLTGGRPSRANHRPAARLCACGADMHGVPGPVVGVEVARQGRCLGPTRCAPPDSPPGGARVVLAPSASVPRRAFLGGPGQRGSTSRTSPSCATLATSRPSRSWTVPRVKARAPEAFGPSIA